MELIDIIDEYFKKNSLAYRILIIHSKAVTDKAVDIAKKVSHLNPDIDFIKEAAMLHDIGICMTKAPHIGCFGKHPYICHGYLGAEILKKKGLPRHALVCERHTGTGLSAEYIKTNNLPIPIRDMLPVSLEERIICYADKFFSKSKDISKESLIEKIREELAGFGEEQLNRFDEWNEIFGNNR